MEDGQNQAKWHPDPTGRHQYRYWDGSDWTDNVSDSGVTSTDPLAGPTNPAVETRPERSFRISGPMLVAGLVAIIVLIGLVVLIGGDDSGNDYGTSEVELKAGGVHVARYDLRAGEVIRIRVEPSHRYQDLSVLIGADEETTARTPEGLIGDWYGEPVESQLLYSERYQSDIFNEIEYRLTSDYFSDERSNDENAFDPGFRPGDMFAWEYIDWGGEGGEVTSNIWAPVDGTYYLVIGDQQNVGAEIAVTVDKWNGRINRFSEFSDLDDFKDYFSDEFDDFSGYSDLFDFLDFSDYSDYSDYSYYSDGSYYSGLFS